MTAAAKQVTAIAHPNIALVKYWGKRDLALNLPAAGSLSITLDTIRTVTTVQFDSSLPQDELCLNGQSADPARVTPVLDRLRQLAGHAGAARVVSDNNFPTAAGLASSASGFAALATAASAALQLDLSPAELSIQARLGSGSAARSIFGGFVEMHPGQRADGGDALATPLLAADAWPLRVVIAVTQTAAKSHSSSAGMEHSRATSPYFDHFIAATPDDLDRARGAIEQRDFASLAAVSEHSCLKMHGCMQSSQPGLIYWNGATVDAMHCVRSLRAAGTPVFFTIDAGPQLKAICSAEVQAQVATALAAVPGVQEVVQTGLGGPARVTPEAAIA